MDLFCKYRDGLKSELLTFLCQTEMRKHSGNGQTGQYETTAQPDDRNYDLEVKVKV